jgi:hypothetical protein
MPATMSQISTFWLSCDITSDSAKTVQVEETVAGCRERRDLPSAEMSIQYFRHDSKKRPFLPRTCHSSQNSKGFRFDLTAALWRPVLRDDDGAGVQKEKARAAGVAAHSLICSEARDSVLRP